MNYAENRKFWETAVNSRHSCRSYQYKPIEADKMQQLKDFTDVVELPFEHKMEFRFFKSEGRPLANNLKNPPPDCVAFLSETDLLAIGKTGFAGELLILQAAGLGLDSCWFGHYILSEVERCMPHLGKYANDPLPSYGYAKGEATGVRTICISPLGYWEQKGLRFVDRVASNLMSFKRKPLSELMEDGQNPETLPAELLYAFDLAVKAPSAANSQHWRFHVSDDHKTVTITCLKGFKHFKWEHFDMDIGICASHFWLGLKLQGIDCKVDPELNDDHVVWRFTL